MAKAMSVTIQTSCTSAIQSTCINKICAFSRSILCVFDTAYKERFQTSSYKHSQKMPGSTALLHMCHMKPTNSQEWHYTQVQNSTCDSKQYMKFLCSLPNLNILLSLKMLPKNPWTPMLAQWLYLQQVTQTDFPFAIFTYEVRQSVCPPPHRNCWIN